MDIIREIDLAPVSKLRNVFLLSASFLVPNYNCAGKNIARRYFRTSLSLSAIDENLNMDFKNIFKNYKVLFYRML